MGRVTTRCSWCFAQRSSPLHFSRKAAFGSVITSHVFFAGQGVHCTCISLLVFLLRHCHSLQLCRGSFAIWLLGAREQCFFAFSVPGCSSARLEGTGTKSHCIKYSPRLCCQTLTRLLLRFTGRHRFVTFDRYRTVKSCPMAQKRSTCESHVNESQRLRMLDHLLSRMTRMHANWVVIALYGKGKWNQMLLFRESGKVLAGLDSLFLGHFGSNDC